MRSLFPFLFLPSLGLGTFHEATAVDEVMALEPVVLATGRSARDRRELVKPRSRYMPHQGERECARRRRRMAA